MSQRDLTIGQVNHADINDKLGYVSDLLKNVDDSGNLPQTAVTGLSTTLATKLDTATASTTYAPLASPAFTGTPTAPTAAAGTSTTQLATTAFVESEAALGSWSAFTPSWSSASSVSVTTAQYRIAGKTMTVAWQGTMSLGTGANPALTIPASKSAASTVVVSAVPWSHGSTNGVGIAKVAGSTSITIYDGTGSSFAGTFTSTFGFTATFEIQ